MAGGGWWLANPADRTFSILASESPLIALSAFLVFIMTASHVW